MDCISDNFKNDGTDHDEVGHGTMIGGLIGSIDNSIGRVGVAPDARLWSVRISNEDGYSKDSAVLCAYEWLIDHADTIEVASSAMLASPLRHECGTRARSANG